jgi:uncharacterized protein
MTRTAIHIALSIWVALVGAAHVSAQPLQRNSGGPSIVRLAERGDARAQTRLGVMLWAGRGIPQNAAEAVYWFSRAAEQGNPDAQYYLGLCYDLGKGVMRDWVLAHKWFNLSAAHTREGEERDYRARMRNAIAFKLSNEQVGEAEDLALWWRPIRER